LQFPQQRGLAIDFTQVDILFLHVDEEVHGIVGIENVNLWLLVGAKIDFHGAGTTGGYFEHSQLG